MLEKLKRDFKKLRNGQPGTRFRDYRKFKQQNASGKKPIARVGAFLFGMLLILGGLAIGWLPGPGGFIAFIGLAMISREIPGIATVMDKCELLIRGMFQWFKIQPRWLQVSFVIVATTAVATCTWFGYRWLS